mgnify:FL=1
MSDYERHEPMTRGEKKEVGVEPHPDYFPGPSEHTVDLIDACNIMGTIVGLIEDGNISGAWAYATDGERIMEKRISLVEGKE